MTTSFQDAAPSALVSHSAGKFHRDRAAEQAAVDVALEAAVERGESELPAIRAFGAQVEAGGAQPRRHDVLAAMAGLEDAQRLRLELPALVFWDGKVIELNLPQAFAAESGRADIAPRRLGAVAGDERCVDCRVDGNLDAGLSAWAFVLAARTFV